MSAEMRLPQDWRLREARYGLRAKAPLTQEECHRFLEAGISVSKLFSLPAEALEVLCQGLATGEPVDSHFEARVLEAAK